MTSSEKFIFIYSNNNNKLKTMTLELFYALPENSMFQVHTGSFNLFQLSCATSDIIFKLVEGSQYLVDLA
jgi:hypothetical protein